MLDRGKLKQIAGSTRKRWGGGAGTRGLWAQKPSPLFLLWVFGNPLALVWLPEEPRIPLGPRFPGSHSCLVADFQVSQSQGPPAPFH